MVKFPEPQQVSASLRDKVRQQTDHALACGALQPIETRYEFLEQGGMRFLVRMLANLVRKEKANQLQATQGQQGKAFNPFLPYDPDLFVADLSATHLCLLNKYNVVDHHVLVVTRDFEEQDTWLTLADFQALAIAMAAMDGLGFYNGGRVAGASQRHKHLQLVPLPLCPDGSALPLSQAIAQLSLPKHSPGHHPDFSFSHGIIRLPSGWLKNLATAGSTLQGAYQALLIYLGIDPTQSPEGFPYNLLVTQDWMMAVGRRQEHYQSIPVNSLGFAGSLLVKDEPQLALLKTIGPMTLLRQVAG
jgi:ATP adenylyltransferase